MIAGFYGKCKAGVRGELVAAKLQADYVDREIIAEVAEATQAASRRGNPIQSAEIHPSQDKMIVTEIATPSACGIRLAMTLARFPLARE